MQKKRVSPSSVNRDLLRICNNNATIYQDSLNIEPCPERLCHSHTTSHSLSSTPLPCGTLCPPHLRPVPPSVQPTANTCLESGCWPQTADCAYPPRVSHHLMINNRAQVSIAKRMIGNSHSFWSTAMQALVLRLSMNITTFFPVTVGHSAHASEQNPCSSLPLEVVHKDRSWVT